MIALINDLEQQSVNKKSTKSKAVSTRFRQTMTKLWANHKKRKADNTALNQLMQLDDALLKDMGLCRVDLVSIRNGTLTFDSLVKQAILSNRDNECSTISLRK